MRLRNGTKMSVKERQHLLSLGYVDGFIGKRKLRTMRAKKQFPKEKS